jgi:hypothetical protein
MSGGYAHPVTPRSTSVLRFMETQYMKQPNQTTPDPTPSAPLVTSSQVTSNCIPAEGAAKAGDIHRTPGVETPNENMQQSNSPRTDAEAVLVDFYTRKHGKLVKRTFWSVPATFARELERDLAARDAELARVKADLERFTGGGLLDCHAICDQRDAANSRADALGREVERLTGIERSHNAQRNLAPDQRTIPDDDAGRAAYWKGRAKSIEGDFARLSDSLLKEGEAKDTARAEATKWLECAEKFEQALQSVRTQCMAPGHAENAILDALHVAESALAQYRHLSAQREGGK